MLSVLTLSPTLSAPVVNTTAPLDRVVNLTAQDAITYDKVRSARLVAFSGIAYCTGTLGKGVANWDCAHCKDFPSVKASTFSSKGFSAQNGYVAYDPNDGTDGSILVVFTGTDPLKFQQWIDDIDTIAVSYPGCTGCKVHEGFYDNYKAVRSQMHTLLNSAAVEHPKSPVYITGHSLGAAVALHAAVEVAGGTHGSRFAGMYTFGQPRVGNSAFATWAASRLGRSPHFRVTHRRDPVPHLPLEAMGFHHPEREVFYSGSSDGSYKLCDGSGEDSSCSDKYAMDVLVTDHTEYVGFDMITNYLTCKL